MFSARRVFRRVAASVDRRTAMLVAALLIAELGYVFLGSAGHWTHWPFMEKRIDELAESFRAGQLHLLIEPDPALVQASNPYDGVNARYWYWDASYYKGHYFFYWGPVPALLLAGAKTLLRVSRPLGDYYPVLGLVTLHLVAGALLIDRVARRLFPDASAAEVAAAVLLFAFANPLPFILARPAIYEGAIVGGQTFLLFGLLFAFLAIDNAGHRRRRIAHAVACGSAFALALGCRMSLGPAMVVVAILTAVMAAGRAGTGWRGLLETLLAVGVPIAAGGVALLAYNRLRFDHWFEFGQRYQLNWIPWRLSPAFAGVNLYSYAFRAGQLSCHFPFVRSPMDIGAAAFPASFHLPPGYFVYESVLGAALSVPMIWLAPAAFVRGPAAATPPAWPLLRALATLLAVAAVLGLAPVLAPPSATMRYMDDFLPPLLILALAGAWNLRRLTAGRAVVRRSLAALAIVLALVTGAVGFALGFSGYYDHFKSNNPELTAKLDAALSVCGHHR